MRLALFVLISASVLALASAGVMGSGSTQAENVFTPAITDCAQDMGAAVQGGACSQVSLDSTPGTFIGHAVLAGACGNGDLHVVRYLPAGSSEVLAATYCR